VFVSETAGAIALDRPDNDNPFATLIDSTHVRFGYQKGRYLGKLFVDSQGIFDEGNQIVIPVPRNCRRIEASGIIDTGSEASTWSWSVVDTLNKDVPSFFLTGSITSGGAGNEAGFTMLEADRNILRFASTIQYLTGSWTGDVTLGDFTVKFFT
jgi:hypothetical protein